MNLFLDSINNKLLIFLLVFFTTAVSVGIGALLDMMFSGKSKPKKKKSISASPFPSNDDSFIGHK